MKKILFITPQLCFPPTDGGKQAQYYPIMAIGEKIETYAIMVNIDETNSQQYVGTDSYLALKERLQELQIFERYNPKFQGRNTYGKVTEGLDWFCGLRPRCAQIFYSPEKKAKVMKYINDNNINIVCIEFPYMAELIDIPALQGRGVKVVCVAHNVESVLLQEVYSQHAPWLRNLLDIDVRKLVHYEKNVLRQVDLVLAISKLDEEYIRKEMQVPRVAYVPVLLPDRKERWSGDVQAKYMVFNGSLSFYPNYHGMKWLLEGIHEQLAKDLPEFTIKITGKVPAKIQDEFKKYTNVEFTGMLSSAQLTTTLQHAKFAIIPIVKGSGTKMKILELMAYGIPIITTSQGIQGFDVGNQPLVVADSPGEFYNKMLLLAKDDQACIVCGAKSRGFFEKNFLDGVNVDKWVKELVG
jgi:glycosyltransferase involved in cell wall biosynthesis